MSLETPAAQKEDGERDAAERRHRTYLSESQTKTKSFLLRHMSAVSRERVGVCEYCSVPEGEANQERAKNFTNNQVNLLEGKKPKKKHLTFSVADQFRFFEMNGIL